MKTRKHQAKKVDTIEISGLLIFYVYQTVMTSPTQTMHYPQLPYNLHAIGPSPVGKYSPSKALCLDNPQGASDECSPLQINP